MLLEEQPTEGIIGAAIEVDRELGPGLLESSYQKCLAREFDLRGIKYRKEVDVPVEYKGIYLECAYRMDFIVEGKVIVEVKAVEKLISVHEAQTDHLSQAHQVARRAPHQLQLCRDPQRHHPKSHLTGTVTRRVDLRASVSPW